MTSFYFPHAFRSNSSHYQLMDLFKRKESFKEKFIQIITEKLVTEKLITSKAAEKLSLIAAGFHIFYRFCLESDQIFKNKNWCKDFNFAIITSNKVYFIASMKALL